jgi:hypothetical protein
MVNIAPGDFFLHDLDGSIGRCKLPPELGSNGLSTLNSVFGDAVRIGGVECFEGGVVFFVIGLLILLSENQQFLFGILTVDCSREREAKKHAKKTPKCKYFFIFYLIL